MIARPKISEIKMVTTPRTAKVYLFCQNKKLVVILVS
jgi:hypothetical protein